MSNRREAWKKIILKFKAPDGYAVESYYGTGMMKLKKNNMYQVQLMYDYSKRAVTSDNIVFDNIDNCLKVISILEEFAQDGREHTLDDEMDDILGSI